MPFYFHSIAVRGEIVTVIGYCDFLMILPSSKVSQIWVQSQHF